MHPYTKKDYTILQLIYIGADKTKPNSKLNAISVKELAEKSGISVTNIRRSIKYFFEDEFITYGVCDGRTKRYSITPKGLRELLAMTEGLCDEDEI